MDMFKRFKEQDNNLRFLSLVLLAYGIYVTGSAVFNLLHNYIGPTLFPEPGGAGIPVMWPLALINVFNVLLVLTMVYLALSRIMARRPMGWWICAAIFTSWLFSSGFNLLVFSFSSINGESMLTRVPSILFRVLCFFVAGLAMTVYIFRKTVMSEMNVAGGSTISTTGKVFLLGFIVFVIQIALVMLVTLINAVVMN